MKILAREEWSVGRPLPLTNDGSLQLFFVGAGNAFSKKFYQTNLLVIKGDTHLLIDCGTRTPEALAYLGLPVTKIDNFLITHSHADHIGGLEEVMLMNRYAESRRKPAIVLSKAYQRELWSMSLRGGCAFNERHGGHNLAFEDFWTPVHPKRIRDADRQLASAQIGSLKLTIFRTKHIPDNAPDWSQSAPSHGVIIDDRVLFTSDTRYDPQMVQDLDAVYKFETIFHDGQLFTGGVHASMDELDALPAEIKAKMYLMHYQDSVDAQKTKALALGFAGFAEQWRHYAFD
jgi:ribonuclease BN (tRNA processing enzyme)